MNALARKIQKVYLLLLLFHTLAIPFIWLARRERAASDAIVSGESPAEKGEESSRT